MAPVFAPGSLPVGLQIVGAPYNESAVLRVARYLEKIGVASAPVAKGYEEPGMNPVRPSSKVGRTPSSARDPLVALSRRAFLGGAAASLAHATTPNPLVLGFLYNGPKNDLGYNQAHAEGKQSLRRYPWVNALEEASVPETVAAEESMRNMIHQDRASAVFATSFGFFDPFAISVARKNPNVQFFHCGGMWQADKHPKNIRHLLSASSTR